MIFYKVMDFCYFSWFL